MAATARFFIRKGLVSSPASDRGYDALEGDVLELGLESPELDVQKVEFSIVRLGRWTTTPTVRPSSGLLATRSSVLQLTVQALQSVEKPAAIWIRCRINDGRNASGALVSDYSFERIVVVRNANGLRGSAYGETLQYSANSYADQIDELSSTLAIVAPSGRSVSMSSSADETLSSAARHHQSALTGPVKTKTIPDGTYNGQVRHLRRDFTSPVRERFVCESGAHVAWLNRRGLVSVIWDEDQSRWFPMGSDLIEKTFRPEDFGDGVGVGDATADRAALVAMFAALLDFANQSDNELAATVQLSTMYYVTSGVDVAGTDYTALRIKGLTPGGNGGFRGCGIKFTGATPAVMTGSPSLTFDRATRKITRSAGSFIADGFAVGQMIDVYDPSGGSLLNNRIYTIESLTDSAIVVVAPAATYPAVSFPTDGMMPYSEGPLAGFSIVQNTYVLRIKGASGVLVEDAVIDGDRKTLRALWADIVPDDPNATNMRQVRVIRVSVFGKYNHARGANIAIGRPGSVSAVGSDLNNTWIVDTACQSNYGDRLGACIRYEDGNNTKLHRVIGCELWSAHVAIDHGNASEGIAIEHTHVDDADIFLINNGYASMSDCHSERVGMIVDGSRGRLVESNNSWNLSGSAFVARQSSHHQTRCTTINDTVKMSVTSINTGTGIITATNNGARTPVDGDLVVVRSSTGWLGMPGITRANWTDRATSVFWLGDVTSLGGGSYTFSLRQTPGGVAAGLTSSGTNVWILSPCVFVTNTGLNKPSGDGAGMSFDSCHIQGAIDIPHVGTSDGTQVVLESNYAAVSIGRASVRHSFGFTPGPVLQALAEVASVPMYGNAQMVPQTLYYAEQCEWVGRGINGGWSLLRFRAAALAAGTFRAGGFGIVYLDLPSRCGIEMVTTEVVTTFAAPGLTAATVKIGHTDVGQGDGDDDDAYLLTTSLMAFPNAADRRKGFAAGERGVRLASPPYWPKYVGATDWSWSGNRMVMIVRIDLTGATLSQLTAGDLIVGVKLIQLPEWRRT